KRLKILGIPHIRFHDLRHGFATRAINGAGVDPKTVAEILGHEHCDITLDIYTSCTAKMQIEAMEQIQNLKKKK
ncbi:MAG: tyrosine-type recombinase/integrase, partial [Oscillospiraceae bacterium]|nr:tyrosine-type recombinase/integrase [Oscillospiraceae bacterium]